MSRSARRFLLVVPALMGLLLAGCGGESSTVPEGKDSTSAMLQAGNTPGGSGVPARTTPPGPGGAMSTGGAAPAAPK